MKENARWGVNNIEDCNVPRKSKKNKYSITDMMDAKRPVVYEQGKHLADVLHNIIVDLREGNDQSLYEKWGIPFKSSDNWFNISLSGPASADEFPGFVIKVNELSGGFRADAERPDILANRAKDTIKLLESVEKAIKKEFKERTGKALVWKSKPQTAVNWEMVAYNGLYRFFATRSGTLKTKLEPQEYERLEV
jgi:hypothetical protein